MGCQPQGLAMWENQCPSMSMEERASSLIYGIQQVKKSTELLQKYSIKTPQLLFSSMTSLDVSHLKNSKTTGSIKSRTSPHRTQVCNILYIYNYVVIAIAANKSDLYEKEQVPEEEARSFAKNIGAIFRLTSAYTASGVEDLFRAIGSKYLDPNFVDSEKKPIAEKNKETKKNNVVLSKQKAAEGNKKKGCC